MNKITKKNATHVYTFQHPVYGLNISFYYGFTFEQASKTFTEIVFNKDANGYCVSDDTNGIHVWIHFHNGIKYDNSTLFHELWHCFFKIHKYTKIELTDENTACGLTYLYNQWEYGLDEWEYKLEK